MDSHSIKRLRDLPRLAVQEMMNNHLRLYQQLQAREKITPEVERDFAEFWKALEETVIEMGQQFSMQAIYNKIPGNSWVVIWKLHKSSTDNK